MTYKNLYDAISIAVKANNSRSILRIKDEVNEQIREFCRFKEWQNIRKTYSLTTDGSDSYNLDTVLQNRCMIQVVMRSDNTEMHKYPYTEYIGMADKSQAYSIRGNLIYINGTGGTFDVLYTSFGSKHAITITEFVAAGSTLTLDNTIGLSVGEYFTVAGTISNNGVLTIATVPDGTTITVNEAVVNETIIVISVVGPDRFPLVDNSDENDVSTHYPDVIELMVVMIMQEEYGETDITINRTRKRLETKLLALSRKENRENNSGQVRNIARGSGIVE